MKRLILSIFLLLALCGQAWADTTFTDTGDHDWNNAANWSAGVPDADENITIAAGSVALPSNISIPTKTFTLTAGTIDLAGHTLTCSVFSTSNTNTREIKDVAGGGKIVLIKGSFSAVTDTNLTISNAPDVELGDGQSTWTRNAIFNGAGKTWGDLYIRRHAGNYYAHITGANTFGNVTIETPNDNYPYSRFRIPAIITQTILSLSGSGTPVNPIEIFTESAVNAGTLSDSSGTNTLHYAKIATIAVSGGASWNVSDGSSINVGYNAGWAWPPKIYYVSNAGTDDTGSEACYLSLIRASSQSTPLATVARLTTCTNALSNNDTIAFNRGDVWAEQLINATPGLTFTAYGTGNPPRFTGATFSIRSNVATQTFQNLWLSDLPIYFSSTASNTTLKNCLITDAIGGSGAIQLTGTTASVFNNTINTRSVALYISNAAANVNISNNLIIGGTTESISVTKQSGACTLSNNLFAGTNARPEIRGANSGCTDGGGNIGMAWTNNVGITDSVDAKVISAKYPTPRVAIVRDDRQNAAAFLADIAAAQSLGVTGYKETLADFAYGGIRQPTEVALLRSAIDAGHEVVLHSSTGSAVGQPSPYTAFTVSTTNSGTNTLTIDASSAKTLTLTSSGNPENNISLDWSTNRKDVCDLKAALGQNGCTALAYTGQGWTITPDSNVSSFLSLSSLADRSCSSFPCVVALDKGTATNRFLYDEIVAGKTVLEAELDRPIYSFLAHQLTDAASTTYIKETELYKGQRSGNEAGTTPYINSINIFLVYGTPSQAFAMTNTTDEATVRANTRTIWGWAQYSGGVIATYFHTTNYITSEQVGWIVDEFSQLGVVFVTFSELVDWIKSDHDTADGYTYTKTYPNTSDYRLKSGSPAINAGVAIDGLTTDVDGKRICGKPEIGAYERCSKGFF
jgi:hypothetical protein